MEYENRARPIRKQSNDCTSGGASHERSPSLLANKNKAEDSDPESRWKG